MLLFLIFAFEKLDNTKEKKIFRSPLVKAIPSYIFVSYKNAGRFLARFSEKKNCTFFSGDFPVTGTSKPTKIMSITCLLMEETVKAMGTVVLFHL